MFSFKVYLRLALLSVVTHRADRNAFLEAERIVFVAEGLLLAHDLAHNCGIRAK